MNTPHPFWGSTIIGVESRSDAVEFRQAVAETGKKLGLRHRRRFHGAHKAVDSNVDLAAQFLEKSVFTAEGLRRSTRTPPRCSDGEALADEMSAKNSLIKVTYENALNGVAMYQYSADPQNTPLGGDFTF